MDHVSIDAVVELDQVDGHVQIKRKQGLAGPMHSLSRLHSG